MRGGKEFDRTVKRKLLAFFLLLVLLLTSGCGAGEVSDSSEELSGVYDRNAAAQMREDRQIYLTLWSWQISSAEDAEEYAELALECGFTAIDFAVLWADFEPVRNHFDWTFLDGVMNVFYSKGLKVSLQPLLWTKDLSWADELALQQSAPGMDAEFEGRGGVLSFCNAQNREIVKNTVQVFALHASRNYGASLTRWGVRLSYYGEADYSLHVPLDRSAEAETAFYGYLKEKFGSYEELARVRGLLGVTDAEGLEQLGLTGTVQACPLEWREFRQEKLLSFLNLIFSILRSADGEIPIVWQLGTFGNGRNTAYSGILDPARAADQLECDIVSVAFNDGIEDAMLLSFAETFGKEINAEVDGAFAFAEGRDCSGQVELCGKYGVFSVSTANFTAEQLREYRDALSRYPALFSMDAVPEAGADSVAILILSETLAQGGMASYRDLYGNVWRTLSRDGAARVRFLTAGQISEHPEVLSGLSALYCGDVGAVLTLPQTCAEALASGQLLVYAPRGAESEFRSVSGLPFSEEILTLLLERFRKPE